MKDTEIIAGDLSPCARIFIESLLKAELTTSVARDAGGTEKSIAIKKEPTQARRPEVKKPEVEKWQKTSP